VLSFNISIDEHLILIAYIKLHIACPPDIHVTYTAYWTLIESKSTTFV